MLMCFLSNAWKLWHEGDNKKPVHTNQPYDEVLSGNAWMSHAVKVRNGHITFGYR